MAFPLSFQEHEEIEYRIENQTELIVAASILYEGMIFSLPRPARHGHIINWLSHRGLRTEDRRYDCGFLTNHGRHVGRVEAGRIVMSSYQGTPGGNPINNPSAALHSEDMWIHPDELHNTEHP